MVQYDDEYLVSTVVADGLVLRHQSISSHSTVYIPDCVFQLFMS